MVRRDASRTAANASGNSSSRISASFLTQLFVEFFDLGLELFALFRLGDAARWFCALLPTRSCKVAVASSSRFLKLIGLGFEFVVAEPLEFRLEFVDFIDIRTNALDLAVIFGADDLFNQIPHA